MEKFSVLMSLYFKEKPEYLRECLESVINQTVKPDEIVIVLDGPVGEELQAVLDEYVKKYPTLFKIVPLEVNQGLGLALREGILHCNNELVARIDTDDINRKDRFELQLKEFEKDPELDICGCHMAEFEGSIDNIVAKRTVPLDDKAVYEHIFQTENTNFVFQFESDGMKKLLRDLHPTCFNDLILAVSVYRPGPMDFIPDILDSKNNGTLSKITERVPILRDVLKETYGYPVYQEQVMKIMTTCAGFSMGMADNVRRLNNIEQSL